MSIRPWRDIQRRKSREIFVGDVKVGGDSPITVQSMTNTLTTDSKATINQIRSLILGIISTDLNYAMLSERKLETNRLINKVIEQSCFT